MILIPSAWLRSSGVGTIDIERWNKSRRLSVVHVVRTLLSDLSSVAISFTLRLYIRFENTCDFGSDPLRKESLRLQEAFAIANTKAQLASAREP
jgi:hypothetical protein